MSNIELNEDQKILVEKLIRIMAKPEACCEGFSEYDERKEIEIKLGIAKDDNKSN